MIDHIRRSKKEVELSEGVVQKLEAKALDNSVINDAQIKSDIIKGLNQLKPKNRKIFELNKFEGLTYREIADHLDISERAVEDNMARAFKSLKGFIDKKEKYYN